MARIPTYQPQFDKESVDLNAPKQSLNAPLAAFGSDGAGFQEAGKGLMNVGTALAVATAKMNEEKAVADATNATIEYHKSLDADIADMRSRKMGDAVDLVKSWDEVAPKKRDEIAANLSPRAQELFSKKAAEVYLDNRRLFANHEAEQRREYLVQTNTSLADLKGATAETNYTDRASVDTNIAEGKAALETALRAKGISPESEVGKGALAKYESQVLGKVVDRFVSARDFSSAKVLLGEFREAGRLQGADSEKIELKLKSFELQNQADHIAASWKNLGPDAAFNAALKIEDPELRRMALGQKRAMDAERDRARSQYVQDSIVRGVDMVDQLSNDPVRLQQYLDSLPKGSPDALRIQQHVGTYGRQVIAAATGATGRFTNAGSYMSLLGEIGPGGSVINEKELMARPEMARVDITDRKKLIDQLKGNTTIDRREAMKQYMLAAGYANGDDPQAKLSPDEKSDFMRFQEYAEALTKDTKQGKDPEYIKKLAARWKLDGETKSDWFPGYGRSRSFSDAVKLPPKERESWVPSLPEKGTEDRAKIDSWFSDPAYREQKMAEYKTKDLDLVKRMVFRDLQYGEIPMMPKRSIGSGRNEAPAEGD
jgi:hypothetical protein